MADRIRELEDLGSLDLALSPLPAAEVRRRGDRRRRRDAALLTSVAALAVAAVVLPVALLTGGDGDARPVVPEPVAPTSTATAAPVVTAIPPGFPIDLDQSEPGVDGEVLGPSRDASGIGEPELCGTPVWTAEPVDRLASVVTGIEYADTRELRTYASADEAVAELAGARAALAACPEDPFEGGTTFHRPLDATTGYDTVTWSVTSDAGTGADLVQLVRVGNSVLATWVYAEFGAEVPRETVRERTALAARIAPSMCVFTAAGCG